MIFSLIERYFRESSWQSQESSDEWSCHWQDEYQQRDCPQQHGDPDRELVNGLLQVPEL